jgi:hypothetical protein
MTKMRIELTAPDVGSRHSHAFANPKEPKARYAVVPQRFKNWTLPRLLPVRMLDAYLTKQMKLTKR